MDFSKKGKTSVTVKILGLDVVIDKHYITIKDSSKVKDKKSMESILKIARNMALKKATIIKELIKVGSRNGEHIICFINYIYLKLIQKILI